MAKVRRFFYVASPRSTTLHMNFDKVHSEGVTACGRPVGQGLVLVDQPLRLARGTEAALQPMCVRAAEKLG